MKRIRSYPQTLELKARAYEPEFSNWVTLVIVVGLWGLAVYAVHLALKSNGL